MKKTYTVTIREIYEKEVSIEAANSAEAENLAHDGWRGNAIKLSDADFQDVEFVAKDAKAKKRTDDFER